MQRPFLPLFLWLLLWNLLNAERSITPGFCTKSALVPFTTGRAKRQFSVVPDHPITDKYWSFSKTQCLLVRALVLSSAALPSLGFAAQII